MQRQRTDTVAHRAAEYFGVEQEPRESVKVGPHECVLVFRKRPGGECAFAYYDERELPGRPRGDYLWLTDNQRWALLEALS
jgi:hypothetical protein